MNRNSTLFTALGIVGFIYGIIFSITIIGLIIGIPLLIGANKFIKYSSLTDEEVLGLDRQNLTTWLVVFIIFTFPAGLIALIILLNLEGQLTEKSKEFLSSNKNQNSMDDKIRKIKELQQMKEQGIITEDDFVKAKEKILSE